MFDAKLIILRGNSGSGKTTVAKRLREEGANAKIAIVEQDYLRRIILKEKEKTNGDNIALIEQTVLFALKHNYDVILEGILSFPKYEAMVKRLISKSTSSFSFYFDISFAETLRRHRFKPNSHEFGEEEMMEWYRSDQSGRIEREIIIPETCSLKETVDMILSETQL